MKSNRAFSLIELMVVLSLLLLIMSIVVVHVSYSRRCMVACVAYKLMVICRYLQLCALISKDSRVLKIDIQAGGYSYDNVTERLPDHVQFNYADGVKGPPSVPLQVVRSAVTFKHNEIIFNPDGIISPGTVYLTSMDKQVMYAISSPVAQRSSLCLYRYDGSWRCRSQV